MTYSVVLGKWTEQGIKNVKEAPKRVEEAHKAIEYRGKQKMLKNQCSIFITVKN